MRQWFKAERSYIFALFAVVVALWCWVFGRTSIEAWNVASFYEGDGLFGMALMKGAADGHVLPFITKIIPELGFPFGSNISDYPITENIIFLVGGMLGKIFGLMAASNLLLLGAYVLAAVSFYSVCRILKMDRDWSFMGGLAFAFTNFMTARAFPHIVLGYYWHLPLCLLISFLYSVEPRPKKLWPALVVAAVTGMQNPYYTNFFVQFMCLGAMWTYREKRDLGALKAHAKIIAVAVACFLANHLGTIVNNSLHGRNRLAVARNFGSVEFYALKPLDLILPSFHHSFAPFARISHRYLTMSGIAGEAGTSYMGILAILGLFALFISLALKNKLSSWRETRFLGLQATWIGFYSVIGGLNGVIAFAGIYIFRCCNRASIVIQTIGLLFAIKALSDHYSRRSLLKVVLLLGAFALFYFDQVQRPISSDVVVAAGARGKADKEFFEALEARLKPASQVFNLPAMGFPEVGPTHQLGDYQLLRPYLHSKQLSWSFGYVKGRDEGNWAQSVSALNAKDFVSALKEKGFSAILLNRKGYVDGGAAKLTELSALATLEQIDLPDSEWVAFQLKEI